MTEPRFPFQPLRSGNVTLADAAAAQLGEAIRQGRFTPGDRLPGEQQLAGEFGVSRPVVREAISRLQQEGLVEKQHGRGAFVTDPARSGVFRISPSCFAKRQELAKLLEMRTGIEADAAALAAVHRRPADLAEMRAEIARMQEADARGRDGAAAWVAAENAFYAVIARAAGNEHLRAFLRMMTAQIDLHLASVVVKNAMAVERGSTVLAEHRAVLAAVTAGSAEEARAAARRHFSAAAARLVARADLADV
ncbi:FadR/GntR family transcriptional regulator [Teichococcus coralli]|uniref:FadR/GntR family transcriptional regulator n=1 Tax=Teichococcus coralli TaxID=2545983 RepID=UPI00136DA984